MTGAVGWRKDSIKYKKNEVFLDIVEQVNLACLLAQPPTVTAEAQPVVIRPSSLVQKACNPAAGLCGCMLAMMLGSVA